AAFFAALAGVVLAAAVFAGAALVAVLAGAALAGTAFAAGFCAGATFATLPGATRSLEPGAGRDAGAEVFFTLTASPVRGLRAMRAARSRFSKTPKPVMETLSPLVTAF